MATYPNDATASVTAFPVLAESTFSNTGATTTFTLPQAAAGPGEVAAFVDGVLQATTAYTVSGTTITFLVAPNATTLTLKVLSLPARFKVSRQNFTSSEITYSNTTAQTVASNTYLINANTQSFALPAGTPVDSKSEIMLFLSGVFQDSNSYTFPSVVLGNSGIDIAEPDRTKLLLNLTSNLTDESDTAATVTHQGSAAYTTFGDDKFLVFDGSADYLTIPSSNAYHLQDRQKTLDMFVRPQIGATMASNQTLFARYEDDSNYYVLRLVGANSNVGFVSMKDSVVSEAYGGNANGGSNYHVAVSYEPKDTNLRLFVNNVMVNSAFMQSNVATEGDVGIGANSGGAEKFTGNVSFVRMTESLLYSGTGHQPLLNTAVITKEAGAPLGAVDSGDTLTVRIFDSAVETIDRFTSMADRRPDTGIESSRTFDTIKFESQAGYEKRRLRSRRSKRTYTLTYTNVTGIEKQAIENFYIARSGEFESFSFDLSHINESGTITTRFEGPLQVNQVLSSGANLTQNFYTINFNLKEVYD